VGLLSAILQGSFAAGPGRVWWDIKSSSDTFMRALGSAQYPTARGYLAPAADQALTDEKLAAFSTALTAELGAYQSADAPIEMFKTIRELGKNMHARGGTGAAPQPPPKPIVLTFANGPALTYLSIDEDSAKKDLIRFTDIFILLPNDRCITLFPDKDASIVATGLGIKPVDWR
jgi:hypothetical protein